MINVLKYLFIKLNAVIMDVFPDKQVASNILAAKIKDSGSNPKRPEESHSDQSKYMKYSTFGGFSKKTSFQKKSMGHFLIAGTFLVCVLV